MQPTLFSQKVLTVAGVSAPGHETAQAWQAFLQFTKTVPLTNRVNEDGFEIRFYSKQSGAVVHVGAWVKNTRVPAQYKIVSLPASLFAEFLISPANGYTSSNAIMQKWLDENGIYKQHNSAGKAYSILVYDARYKGESDPASRVACWVPIEKK